MWSISVEPTPSRISIPVRSWKRRHISGGSGSAAEIPSRTERPIGLVELGMGEDGVVEGRHREVERRSMSANPLQKAIRRGTTRRIDGGGAGPHREGEVVSQIRRRGTSWCSRTPHRPPDAEHRTGVVGAGGRHVGVPVDHAFWPPGRSRAVQPKGHVVGMGGHRIDFIRRLLDPVVEGLGTGWHRPVGDNEANRWSSRHLGPHHVEKDRVDDGNGGVGVVEEIAEVVGPGQEVDRDRHRPDPHRPEKSRGESRGVIEDEQHPVLSSQPHLTQTGGGRRDRRMQTPGRPGDIIGGDEDGVVAPALLQPPIDQGADVGVGLHLSLATPDRARLSVMTGDGAPFEGQKGYFGTYELRICGPEGRNPLVFLHDGLGSMDTWKTLPEDLANATGRPAAVYSRPGHGGSRPLRRPRTLDFMHFEALETLYSLIRELEVSDLTLIGHSDGASISLIFSGEYQWASGLVLIAPHVFVEPETIAGIEEVVRRFESTDLPQRMAKYHRDPEATFGAWSEIWLDPGFQGLEHRRHLAQYPLSRLADPGSRRRVRDSGPVGRDRARCQRPSREAGAP